MTSLKREPTYAAWARLKVTDPLLPDAIFSQILSNSSTPKVQGRDRWAVFVQIQSLLLLLYFINPDLSRGICRLPLLGLTIDHLL